MPESSDGVPWVTVVISTLDRPDRLERCLKALSAGTRRPGAVVVVDQGRASSAAAVVEAARDRELAVTHVQQPRWGLSASQNAGFRAASTDVVAVVDDDCVADARWIETVERAFAAADGPLLLTGRVLPMQPEGDRVAAVATRDSLHRVEWRRPPMPWHLGTGGNFAVTRASFEAVGGNDERLGTGAPGKGGNDLDLFYRLVTAGVAARYEPDLLVHHERSTASEYMSRRGSYGFGLGAMLGLWLRSGRMESLCVLAGWLRLRVGMAVRRRAQGGVGNEARVLAGTLAGLWFGITVRGERRPPRDQ